MGQIQELESVVIRFSGDSGDGMQLTGTQFSNTSALMGNDIATFPDFPAEIRAPQGTVAGVSGFQVNIGATHINTPGDEPDVLVAMNPAALKANLGAVKKGGTLIINSDTFTDINYKKAGYAGDPFADGKIASLYKIVNAKISSQTLDSLANVELDNKSKGRCKNFYALGMTYFMFSRDLEPTIRWIESKFKGKDILIKANVTALKAGWNFAETIESTISTYKVPAAKIGAGTYRQIDGNTGTAWGFMQAAEAAGTELFLGSYPITPASDILHELSKHKANGVRTVQCEDEIAGICSAIGASYAGALGITTTSGPGVALKGEAMGLAISYELPLVVVNVQRGGPSTGLPTKTEQSDLYQALYGRNGESPICVVAASRPNDCFHMAYEASRIALEHMTPVVLLTDGYIANGAEPWKLPDLEKDYKKIKTRRVAKDQDPTNFNVFTRDTERLARSWALPGTPGLEHRIGGLEKDEHSGGVSYDPINHERMCHLRNQRIAKIADFIPLQELEGEAKGDLLVISWGGTYGATHMAVREMHKLGKKVSLAHLRYINPMPKNLGEIIKNFKRVVVPELNLGQLCNVINARFQCGAVPYNKVQGLPFKITELTEQFHKMLG
jgi:2-oxoglutarate/2-oxoacid ferredoxin oxidoreductase subunit alpha